MGGHADDHLQRDEIMTEDSIYLRLLLISWSLQGRRRGSFRLIRGAFSVHRVENLARIHQPVWIETSLQCLHDRNGVKAQFFNQTLLFSQANAMLACTCALLYIGQQSLIHASTLLVG